MIDGYEIVEICALKQRLIYNFSLKGETLLANKETKTLLGYFLVLISKLKGFEFLPFHSIILMSEVTCRRSFKEIWSPCKCVIRPLKQNANA